MPFAVAGLAMSAAQAGSSMSNGKGGPSSPAPNQVAQSSGPPQWVQDAGQTNWDTAQAIAAQPFPIYGGQRIAPMDDMQNFALNNLRSNGPGGAYAGAPEMMNAASVANSANPMAVMDPGAIQSAMSPYVAASLKPQLDQLNIQLGQQQLADNAKATQAGAFGDARAGVQGALDNYYGNQARTNLIQQGYNTAFGNAQTALQNATAQQLQQAQALGTVGGQEQNLALTGGKALYGGGSVLQGQQQANLTQAYQDFQNQVNWPIEMLNVRESTLSNTPYTTSRLTTYPQTNPLAQNLGMFASLAGGSGLGKA